MTPTQRNTLYLIINQEHFDAILDGTQKQEYREIKETTYKKFLETWLENGKDAAINFDESKISIEDAQKYASNPMVYNDGIYPYIPIPYKFLNLSVGYNEDRDTMIVAIKNIHFEPIRGKHGKEERFSEEEGRMRIDKNGDLCIWQIVYTLGNVLDADLKIDREQA